MTDDNIIKAQKYLNNMYNHRSEWVKLAEYGLTIHIQVQPFTDNAHDLHRNVSLKSTNILSDLWVVVNWLLQVYLDKLIKSNGLAVGALFSYIERIFDGVTNTFVDAKKDWHKTTCSLDKFNTNH
ncbi:hypothetical protein NMU03_01170 [Allocoprobacillus halotolerans]|uniref:Uncharacterized protein n=1 Tax=Allocoprobacillus halotolerans TaxID=2944914 RepID=A0ABY5I2B6_9FIRM|nr:hypothetical protein [Allocoprobacillus halotolerans]UTY39474.1 hypothetical protein NMU03_01170 [Allocoprobacillus halotolerans]